MQGAPMEFPSDAPWLAQAAICDRCGDTIATDANCWGIQAAPDGSAPSAILCSDECKAAWWATHPPVITR